MVEKLIVGSRAEAKTAVVYSPGRGCGWSTWALKDEERMIFDRELAQAVVDGDRGRVGEVVYGKFPDVVGLGWDGLKVAWLPVGMRFWIDECDGVESIVSENLLVYEA